MLDIPVTRRHPASRDPECADEYGARPCFTVAVAIAIASLLTPLAPALAGDLDAPVLDAVRASLADRPAPAAADAGALPPVDVPFELADAGELELPAAVEQPDLAWSRLPGAEPPDPAAFDDSMRRGIAFLVGYQNSNGSWGGPTRTKGLNIYAPVPGAHHAFRAATTALCISALVETAPEDPDVVAAIEKAEAWLLEHLPRVRRADGRAIYNNWAHAYGLRAAVDLLGWGEQSPERIDALRELIHGQIDRLGRYEYLIGGWGYYDFNAQTQRPSGNSTSFTTATVLIALHDAQEAGIDVPMDMVERGVRAVLRQRNPDNTYVYSSNFEFFRGREVNRPPGSLARSQTCNAALRLWGEEDRITDEVAKEWLDRLFRRNGWLDIGRKRPVPHEAWYAVAGYFYYYGHFYAAHVMQQLPDEQHSFYADHMIHTIMALQEDDGSWWDYPLYDYHQPYGTAMALMALQRCRDDQLASPIIIETREDGE